MEKRGFSRRNFLRTSAWSGVGLALASPENSAHAARASAGPTTMVGAVPVPYEGRSDLPSLAGARWVWYPSERCLANTFVLFRRALTLPAAPRRAVGWIAADSRYRLEVNDQRVQWGPAPADPRWPEADPLDLTAQLRAGENVIGATVLFYGHGDGTWAIGKPGFLFYLKIELENGAEMLVVSDAAWQSQLSRAWSPGHYKRWYLRALQEEFDARRYPVGWTGLDYGVDADWLPAMVLEGDANRPAIATTYRDYLNETSTDGEGTAMHARSIPMLREEVIPVAKLNNSRWLRWRRPVEEYFECRVPEAFSVVEGETSAVEVATGIWQIAFQDTGGAILTFELQEQAVGWPRFTIQAPEGAIVELMVQEGHDPANAVLLNTHFNSWVRFVCREGVNRFESFDFESCRWIQLHIRSPRGVVTVRDVGMRRRLFPWPNVADIKCSEPALQRLFDASVNTLNNCAQETLVDGMGRERQQYSGDVGHQLHAIYLGFGEYGLPARYLRTFSQGMTTDGYFLDCWPAYDRMARLAERELQLTPWGPILDHGVGFGFDCYHHFLYTGQLEALREPYPRLIRFVRFLQQHIGEDGLLPVEGWGVPMVWMDHDAYRQQRHKQCAFNLYVAAMLREAMAPLSRAFGDRELEAANLESAGQILRATVREFWDAQRGIFVANRPWASQEGGIRFCDRSLATSVLFDLCPRDQTQPAVDVLAGAPPELGLSYPANAGWRLWALSKGGRPETILKELRDRWANLDSVRLNNTIQEGWQTTPDSRSQWSHCAVVPLYVAYMSLAGIRPLRPGFERVEIRPQLADLAELRLSARTVRGPIQFESVGQVGARQVTIALPEGIEGDLILRREEVLNLPTVDAPTPIGWRRYRLLPGKQVEFRLRYS